MNESCVLKECPKGQLLASNGECECSSGEQIVRSKCHKLPVHCLRLAPHLLANDVRVDTDLIKEIAYQIAD